MFWISKTPPHLDLGKQNPKLVVLDLVLRTLNAEKPRILGFCFTRLPRSKRDPAFWMLRRWILDSRVTLDACVTDPGSPDLQGGVCPRSELGRMDADPETRPSWILDTASGLGAHSRNTGFSKESQDGLWSSSIELGSRSPRPLDFGSPLPH